MLKKDNKIIEETSFSKFIREADSREKKKVYSEVIKLASEEQRVLVDKLSK